MVGIGNGLNIKQLKGVKMQKDGYQPDNSLDDNNPPQDGSGIEKIKEERLNLESEAFNLLTTVAGNLCPYNENKIEDEVLLEIVKKSKKYLNLLLDKAISNLEKTYH